MIRMLEKYRNTVLGTFFALILSASMLTFGLNVFMDSSSDNVIRVNGEKIPSSEFFRVKQLLERQYRTQFGALAERLIQDLNQQVTERLVVDELLFQFTSSLGLSAPGENVLKEEIKKSFPQGWSLATYRRFLSSIGLTAKQYQRQFRKVLKNRQLFDLIADASIPIKKEISKSIADDFREYSVDFLKMEPNFFTSGKFRKVPLDTLKEFYQENPHLFISPAKVEYTYVDLSGSTFPNLVEIQPDDISAYYYQNIEKFQTPQKIKFQHIQLTQPKGASADTLAAFEKDVSLLFEKVRDGFSMDRAAFLFSDDYGTRWNNGRTEWIAPGQLIPELAQEVWQRALDRTPFVVQTDYGFHIVRVVDYAPPEDIPLDQVAPAIEKELYKQAAPSFLEEKAQMLYAKWNEPPEKSLEQFALSENLPFLRTSGALEANKDPSSDTAGLTAKVLAYSDQTRLIVPLESSQILVEIQKLQEAYTPDFERIQQQVLDTYVKQKAKGLAREALQTIIEKVQTGEYSTLNEVPSDGSFRLVREIKVMPKGKNPTPFDRQETISVLRRAPTKRGMVKEIIELEDSLVAFYINSFQEPSNETITRKIPEYRARAKEQQSNLMTEALINALKHRSKIEVPPNMLAYGS